MADEQTTEEPSAFDAQAAAAWGEEGAAERILNQDEIDSLLGFDLSD